MQMECSHGCYGRRGEGEHESKFFMASIRYYLVILSLQAESNFSIRADWLCCQSHSLRRRLPVFIGFLFSSEPLLMKSSRKSSWSWLSWDKCTHVRRVVPRGSFDTFDVVSSCISHHCRPVDGRHFTCDCEKQEENVFPKKAIAVNGRPLEWLLCSVCISSKHDKVPSHDTRQWHGTGYRFFQPQPRSQHTFEFIRIPFRRLHKLLLNHRKNNQSRFRRKQTGLELRYWSAEN